MKKEQEKIGHRYRVLMKLYSGGCKTEKELMALSLENVLKMRDITATDMIIILELQRNVKAHTLYSYLGGDWAEIQCEISS